MARYLAVTMAFMNILLVGHRSSDKVFRNTGGADLRALKVTLRTLDEVVRNAPNEQ